MELREEILQLASRAARAAETLGDLNTSVKNAWLLRAAECLEAAKGEILEANERDMQAARENGVAEPLVNRLGLTGGKWEDMIQGLRDVAALPDPVGEITDSVLRPNGLRVARMRIPLGVIAMIYESRPNVTVDAAALCVKAGNAVILRGGSEAFHSNQALGRVLREAARDIGIPEDAIAVVGTTDRAAIDILLEANRDIDLMIPRGGPGLIRKVMEESTIPVICHDAGVCHIFIDASADTEMATAIVRDSKMRQMAVCNGLETLLVHRDAAQTVLPHVLKALHEEGVEIRGDAATCAVFSEAQAASDDDWAAEYLDKVLAVKVVDDIDAAIEHVRRYGSDHTEVIITNDYSNGLQWQRRITSSTVGVNCSTAFADGFRLGLGAEIGISTSKLHAYGPMGLEGLTTRKFVLTGEGQLRE
ncbi:MAG: glutamate-5-semialdehyde dehydrogenase [Myxococcota bacterium]|jgi:glutamate-5-semialdehyde dehydrogenase|nr:glutamate-5-semialdehyde dehydrogenase [Myxococcota bacterium]